MATYRYFAYGSNMATERLRSRAPSAQPLGAARLPRHVLRWHKLGRDGSGKCDAAPAEAEDAVWGVLFAIDCADKPSLDTAEGLGIGYDERVVHVCTANGRCRAVTYQAKPDRIDTRLRPKPWYKNYVLAGAREHGLPAAYMAQLATVPTEGRDAEQRGRGQGDS